MKKAIHLLATVIALAALPVVADEAKKEQRPEKIANEELRALRTLILEWGNGTLAKATDNAEMKETKEILEQAMDHITKTQDSIDASAAKSAELRKSLERANAQIADLKTKQARPAKPAKD